jgi:hypothetical protein
MGDVCGAVTTNIPQYNFLLESTPLEYGHMQFPNQTTALRFD